MAVYSQAANKRQKTVVKETMRNFDNNEFFPGVSRIEYKPDALPEETQCFQNYNPTERIQGRSMEDLLRPSVSFWHAFCYSGADFCGQATLHRTWNDGSNSMENYKRRIRAAFEFFSKLGNKYWTFFDRDIAPEGKTLEETNHNLDEVSDLILELQQHTGVKPLWVAADLHSHSRYMNGSVTNPEAQVVGMAGAQLKKALELAHKLGAECFLFKDIHEGYATVLNTDVSRELRHYSRLLKMTADYKERLGYRGQLLLEPCHVSVELEHLSKLNCEVARQSYVHDAASALCFLKHYSLDRQYKLSVVPGHQLVHTTTFGMLGSVDATSPKAQLNPYDATMLMKTIIEQGGTYPGGLNIGIAPFREFTDQKDLFVTYISYLDTYAKGLRNAAKIIADGNFTKNLQQRYLSFHTGFGSRLANGDASLEDCEEQVLKHRGDFTVSSGRPEHWEAVFVHYM